jgi:putative sigma-54 modulation protein
MKVHYTGRNADVADISDAQRKKLQAKFDKIHKILGRRHSSEAHVIVSRERHLYSVEVTLHALYHTLVVTASSTDIVGSTQMALEKLEKQAIKNKHKLIDGRRPERQRGEPSPSVEAAIVSERAALKQGGEDSGRPQPRVVHSNSIAAKPLTLEGAIMQLEELGRDHIAYRDAENGQVRVLLRRRDGTLELVEAS